MRANTTVLCVFAPIVFLFKSITASFKNISHSHPDLPKGKQRYHSRMVDYDKCNNQKLYCEFEYIG